MSPHSRLLFAAAVIGTAIVVIMGILLGPTYGPIDETTGTEPMLARRVVIDVDVESEPVRTPLDRSNP